MIPGRSTVGYVFQPGSKIFDDLEDAFQKTRTPGCFGNRDIPITDEKYTYVIYGGDTGNCDIQGEQISLSGNTKRYLRRRVRAIADKVD